MYSAGVLLGYPSLVGLAIGGLVVLGAAVVTVLVPVRLELFRHLAVDRVTVGEPAEFLLELRNLSRIAAPAIFVTDRVAEDPVELRVSGLPPRGSRVVGYSVTTSRRGRFRVGPLALERRDPLGLLRRAHDQVGDDVLWVHPRQHPVRALPVGVVLDYEGLTTDNAKLGALTFSSLREYVPGDDPRRIHWLTTARTGALFVREHVDTTEPTTTIVLDTRSAAAGQETFEHAVQVAASVARDIELTGQPVTLHVVGHEPVHWQALGAVSLLDRLAATEQSPDPDPARLLETAERAAPGGALVVVTGGREPMLVARLAEQRRRYSPIVVIVLLGAAEEGAGRIRRHPGMTVIICRSGAEAAAAWNRVVAGEGA